MERTLGRAPVIYLVPGVANRGGITKDLVPFAHELRVVPLEEGEEEPEGRGFPARVLDGRDEEVRVNQEDPGTPFGCGHGLPPGPCARSRRRRVPRAPSRGGQRGCRRRVSAVRSGRRPRGR